MSLRSQDQGASALQIGFHSVSSLVVAQSAVNFMCENMERVIKMKELEKIVAPYTMMHCLDEGILSICQNFTTMDKRADDIFTSDEYYRQNDDEPEPAKPCLRVPAQIHSNIHYPKISEDERELRKARSSTGAVELKQSKLKTMTRSQSFIGIKYEQTKTLNKQKPDAIIQNKDASGDDTNALTKKAPRRRKNNANSTKQFGMPLNIEANPEDAEDDLNIRQELPKLRKIQLQKDKEKIRKQMAEKSEFLARERLKALTNTKNSRGRELDISEMDLRFDQDGKVMKVKKFDPNALGENGKQFQSLILQTISQKPTNVEQSELMQEINIKLKLRASLIEKLITNDSDASDQLSTDPQDFANSLVKKDDQKQNKKGSKRIFNLDSRSTNEQVEYFDNLVSDVKPSFGVRLKKQHVAHTYRQQPLGSMASVQNQSQELSQFSDDEQIIDGRQKILQSHQSMMDLRNHKEAEEWGKTNDGYQGGGNYEDNPQESKLSIRKYQKLNQMGQLSQLTNVNKLGQAQSQFLNLNSTLDISVASKDHGKYV